MAKIVEIPPSPEPGQGGSATVQGQRKKRVRTKRKSNNGQRRPDGSNPQSVPQTSSAGADAPPPAPEPRDPPLSPIELFFAKFPAFNWDRSKLSYTELTRLWSRHLLLDPRIPGHKARIDKIDREWTTAMRAELALRGSNRGAPDTGPSGSAGSPPGASRRGAPDAGPRRSTGSPLEAFFAKFQGFNLQRSESATSEFRRLWMDHLNLDRNIPSQEERQKGLYEEFSRAMAAEFGWRFGVHMNDLRAWQRLCERIEIPIPDNLKDAREAVFNTHVNLVDLVGHGVLTKFQTEQELSEYSKAEFKIFPSNNLAPDSILRALLRRIENPPPRYSRRTDRGKVVYK